jgi:hypothetical protein
MLLYGLRAAKTGHQNLYGVKCTNCEAQGAMEMHSYSKYLHILRIPFLPVKKVVVTQCNRCRQVLSKKKFSPDLLNRLNEMKKPLIGIPVWQFTGILLVSIIIALGVYKTMKRNNGSTVIVLIQQQKNKT